MDDELEDEDGPRPIRDMAPGRKDWGVEKPGKRIEWDEILSFRILQNGVSTGLMSNETRFEEFGSRV